jgi:succinate dehydrogenase / fumarate reductase flavoprotein subunit
MELNARIPSGPIEKAWDKARFEMKLVNPANKRRHEIIVVGSGLAGGSAAATLAELGYNVKCFCFQDSPRRAHSIAAQGGINAAKNYQNDGDSVYRLFYDTVKGGDFRAREANVYRLAQISVNIIDQCVAQGVPFAREYGGLLANRSFGGAQVSRTFYARGQTGQQLLLGAYQALERQIDAGTRAHVPAHRNARPGGDRRTRARNRHARPGHGRDRVSHRPTQSYSEPAATETSTIFRPTPRVRTAPPSGARTNAARRSRIHASRRFTRRAFRCRATTNPSSRLMSESLRNDGRIWVPVNAGDKRPPGQIPETERDYYLERCYPSFGNLVPRDVASRKAKAVCDEGRGVGEHGLGVYLDFADAIKRMGANQIRERYGNLFEMYQRITDEDPYNVPMRIYPAIHYTMGGLWVDYQLMSTIPGLFVIGEGEFFRPRRESTRCERADAGTLRRVLHRAVHDR